MRRTATVLAASAVLALGCGEEVWGPEAAREDGLAGGAPSLAMTLESRNFVSPLSGREEVPPVATRATGNAVFHLSKDETALHYKLIVANLRNATQAHIHCGAAGVNGPVVVFLFGLEPDGVTTNGILAQGTKTPDDVIPRPDSGVCPGGVANFADVIEKMRTGDAYVNVHTIANPPGEIRGQVKEAGPSRR